jgi:hypothetical protein
MFKIYGYDQDGDKELCGKSDDEFGAEVILNEALYEGYGYIRIEVYEDDELIETYES